MRSQFLHIKEVFVNNAKHMALQNCRTDRIQSIHYDTGLPTVEEVINANQNLLRLYSQAAGATCFGAHMQPI